jgi:uncharacterized protein YgfB (UPF0149 family)
MEYYQAEDQPLDFDEFANQLLEQGAEHSPAHLHGAICGFLVGGGKRDPEYCFAAISKVLQLQIYGELAGNCLRLAAVTLAALVDEEFDFHPFLPDDDDELALRVRALADWSSAFLTGYAMCVASTGSGGLDGSAADVLRDVAAIAEADVDAEMDEDEAENHYFEVTEYLRFATLNLFMDQLERSEAEEEAGQQ